MGRSGGENENLLAEIHEEEWSPPGTKRTPENDEWAVRCRLGGSKNVPGRVDVEEWEEGRVKFWITDNHGGSAPGTKTNRHTELWVSAVSRCGRIKIQTSRSNGVEWLAGRRGVKTSTIGLHVEIAPGVKNNRDTDHGCLRCPPVKGIKSFHNGTNEVLGGGDKKAFQKVYI